MEELNDMASSSLMIWRGDLCPYCCRSKTKMGACVSERPGAHLGLLHKSASPASELEGNAWWDGGIPCTGGCQRAPCHPGLPTASSQCHHRGKQRNPKNHGVCLQLHCACYDTTVRSSKLDVHLAACLLAQVETHHLNLKLQYHF